MQTDQPQDIKPPLTPLQQRVALDLACGFTITGAASRAGVSRVTVYRWLKNTPAFAAEVQQNRAEFILSRRDDLHHLSNRAMETILSILDSPRSSQAVLLRAAMFVLNRSQNPGTGWCMPERHPEPEGQTLTDSAVLEKEANRLANLEGLGPGHFDDDVTECNAMQPETENEDGHEEEEDAGPAEPDLEICEFPYSQGILPSCPVPARVTQTRNLSRPPGLLMGG
jgi:hypothetical protein